MIKRLFAQLCLLVSFALLLGCSTNQPSTNTNTTKPVTATASQAPPAIASRGSAKLIGLVTAVTDGDTITVRDEMNAASRIRLQGIDAPEKRQAFGDKSRQNLANLIAGKKVLVEWLKHDQYGRIIGKVFCDNRDICLEQIKAGLAWHYKEFERDQSEADRRLYSEAEQGARSQKLGLWRDSSQIQPWEYRHHKPAKTDASADESPRHFSSPAAANENQESIRANKNSKIYHWPGCPGYNDVAPHNRVTFRTRGEAERAGYRPARNCR